MWGKVKIEDMKYPMPLQAGSSIQVQRGHLRVYVETELLERGKQKS